MSKKSVDDDDDDVKAMLASIHANPIPTVVTDMRQPDNPIIEANEPFALLTGYTREEILGRNCRFLAGCGTEPEARRALREAISNGQPIVVDQLQEGRQRLPKRGHDCADARSHRQRSVVCRRA